MTIAKVKSVSSAAHGENLGRYIDSEKAIMRESRFIADEKNWAREMERTREMYGHDTPSREGAKNVTQYHQIIAFNPDECALNGHGGMTPEDCMDYAREFLEREYAAQEAVMVLHREHCKADGTDRYAVHIAVNRTDLETGKRYHNGTPEQAKARQAELAKTLDRERGLRAVERGRNSRDHEKQPTRAEREMIGRGETPIKQELRNEIDKSRTEVMSRPSRNHVKDLAENLEKKGIAMDRTADKQDFKYGYKGIEVKGENLGGRRSEKEIVAESRQVNLQTRSDVEVKRKSADEIIKEHRESKEPKQEKARFTVRDKDGTTKSAQEWRKDHMAREQQIRDRGIEGTRNRGIDRGGLSR